MQAALTPLTRGRVLRPLATTTCSLALLAPLAARVFVFASEAAGAAYVPTTCPATNPSPPLLAHLTCPPRRAFTTTMTGQGHGRGIAAGAGAVRGMATAPSAAPSQSSHLPSTRLLTHPHDDQFTLPIKTPSLQTRKMQKLVLGNRMNVVVVSDPLASMAGAALAVETGSWRDSRNGQEGLAHFLEHMLFLGTEAHPEENSYDAYIAAHNGAMNAYTSSDHSLYHFEVAPAALEGAMERFSWFFRGPLFNESCVEREQNGGLIDGRHGRAAGLAIWKRLRLAAI